MAKKTNPHRVRYGTADGDLTFGHLTDDNQISSVMIRNFKEPLHYISLSQTGGQFRKNGTICRSTGSFQVRAGDDIGSSVTGIATFRAGSGSMGDLADLSPTLIDESEYTTSDQPGIYLEAVSGDVIIRAPSGKVRIEGQDGIELVATGYDNATGNIILDANEKVILHGQGEVNIGGDEAVSVVSNGRIDLIGNSTINLYSTKVDIVDAVLTKNPFSTLMGVIKGTTTKHEALMTLRNLSVFNFI